MTGLNQQIAPDSVRTCQGYNRIAITIFTIFDRCVTQLQILSFLIFSNKRTTFVFGYPVNGKATEERGWVSFTFVLLYLALTLLHMNVFCVDYVCVRWRGLNRGYLKRFPTKSPRRVIIINNNDNTLTCIWLQSYSVRWPLRNCAFF